MTQDFINLLSKEQKIRLGFYQEFENEADKAYNFVMQPTNNEPATIPSELDASLKDDGIYLIDVNGNAVKFVGDETETIHDTAYIGIVDGFKRLKVSINEFEEPLQEENFNRDSIKDYDGYIKYELDALMDWNGEDNTKHILIQNPALKDKLKDGEYIPALGQLAFIWYHRNQVNEALKFIGCKPLSQSGTWSSTEYSAYYAWYVNFNDGGTNYYNKYYASVVRAVAAF